MANTKVTVLLRTQDKKYHPVEWDGQGRIRTGELTGRFYLSWYVGNKCVRQSVGTSAADAKARMIAKTRQLQDAIKTGVPVISETPQAAQPQDIASAVDAWLIKIAKRRDGKTWAAYKAAMVYWTQFVGTRLVSDITKDLMMDYHSEFLRDKRYYGRPLSDRTVYNKFSAAVEFLKSVNITTEGLGIDTEDWPKFVATRPRANSTDEINAVMAVCTPKERLLLQFMLATGFRRGEVAHVTWRDVDLAGSTVAVSWKPEYRWKPKSSRERVVRIPTSLRDMLAEAKQAATGPLVFPGDNGRPDTHLLTKLQRVAVRAGLDKKSFNVQRMRKNMATKMDRQGFTTSQLMGMMGHTSATPTARYVDAEIGPDAQAHIDAAFNQ